MLNDAKMSPVETRLDSIKADTFTFTQARGAGLQVRDLQKLVTDRAIERVSRGRYRRTNAPDADLNLIEISTRAPLATICLTSALARYELIDAIPDKLDIALPRNLSHPKTTAAVRWHSFDARTFSIERRRESIPGTDLGIGIYSPERCIIDAFRLRGYVGYEIAHEALLSWLRQRGARPAKLVKLARQLPRAEAPLRTALEYLS
jgi:predicted transcriptional regulator of viral defense system